MFLSVVGLVERPRPDVASDPVPATRSSFPSGHVAASVVFYGGAAAVVDSLRSAERHRIGRSVAAAVPVLVALSRLVLGLHYLSDVAAGAALGLGALLVARRTVGPGQRQRAPGDDTGSGGRTRKRT